MADTVLELKADEILKRDPSLSKEQAYSRAYLDPASRELRVAEKRARDARIAGIPVARTEPIGLTTMSDEEILRSVRAIRGKNPYATDAEVLAAIDAAHSAKLPPIGKRDAAMDALNAKAEELRNMHPTLSPEQAFAKVYKMYPALAKAERSAARAALYA